jgi:hypothetical protein
VNHAGSPGQGTGSGNTLAEAPLRVYRRTPGPDWEDNGPYSDEPPFL